MFHCEWNVSFTRILDDPVEIFMISLQNGGLCKQFEGLRDWKQKWTTDPLIPWWLGGGFHDISSESFELNIIDKKPGPASSVVEGSLRNIFSFTRGPRFESRRGFIFSDTFNRNKWLTEISKLIGRATSITQPYRSKRSCGDISTE